MGPSQICGCPFREPRVFTIAHVTTERERESPKLFQAVGSSLGFCRNVFSAGQALKSQR